MKNYFLTLSVLFSTLLSSAQTDTIFWFAAPEVTVASGNFDRPIVFRITTSSQPTTVTISQPAGGGMPTQIINIAAASTQTVDLTTWINFIEGKPANTILNSGIKIQSTAPITAYYEVVSAQCQCNPEIFVLKGQSALGKDFWIPAQNYLRNAGYSPSPYSSFEIVATQNNTTVTITPSNNIVGHIAGTAFNIVLNQGQNFSATAASQIATMHLQGSRVISDKPIAITIKDDLMEGTPFGGCADLGGDQIVPVELLGTEYIAMNSFLGGPGDQVFVLAIQNGTTILKDGLLLATINAGQTHQFSVGGSSTFIETSAPAYVLQMSGFGCEAGLDILPPIVCTGSFGVSFTRSTIEDMVINVMVQNGGQGNFRVNGLATVLTSTNFTAVPGTGGQWVSAQISLPVGNYPQGTAVTVNNTTSLFHLGLIHGSNVTGSRFGYFSNFAKINVNAQIDTPIVCSGATIFLTADSIPLATYSWTGPLGYNSTNQNPSITNVAINNSGNYIVTASVSGCVSPPDTVSVTVLNCVCPTVYRTSIDTNFCQGTTFTLPSNTTVNTSGTYLDTLITTGGCDSIITINLMQLPVFSTLVFDTICQGTNYTLPTGQIVTTGGIYTHTLTSSLGCDSLITTNIYTIATPLITHLYDSICPNQPYQFPIGTIISAAGNYTDTIATSSGCDSFVVLHLFVFESSAATIYDTICSGSSYTLINGNIILPVGSSPQVYPVLFTNIYGCDSLINTEITIINRRLITNTTNILCNATATGILTTTSPPQAGNNTTITYLMQNQNIIDSNLVSGIFGNLVAGNYTTIIVDYYGCTDTNSITLLEPTPLQIYDTVTNVICFGDATGIIHINTIGGTPDYSYNLNNMYSNNTGQFEQLTAGNYSYTVTDANGCTDTSLAIITEPTTLVLTITPDTIVLDLGQTIQLNATSNYDPNANYFWSPSIGLSCYNCPNPIVETYYSLDYILKVSIDVNGTDCTINQEVSVTVLPDYNVFIPNVFTPNGDGQNDFWQLFGNLKSVKQLEVTVFNRWGEKVFESNNIEFKWNGYYKGVKAPMGVYVYVAKFVWLNNHSDTDYKGSLTIMR